MPRIDTELYVYVKCYVKCKGVFYERKHNYHLPQQNIQVNHVQDVV